LKAFGVGMNPFRVVGRPDLQPVCPKPVHHVHHLVAVSVPYELAYVHAVHVIGVCARACNSDVDRKMGTQISYIYIYIDRERERVCVCVRAHVIQGSTKWSRVL